MVSAAADTQREIGEIRRDMTAAVAELRRRVGGGTSGLAQGEARVAGARARETLVQRSRDLTAGLRGGNAAAASVVATTAVAGLGYAAYSVAERWRARRAPQNRLRRRATGLRGDVEDRVQQVRERAKLLRERGILLKVDREGENYLRVTGASVEALKTEGTRSKVLKNLLWAAMLSVFMAVASILARRVAGAAWKATLREDPPTEKK